MLSMRKVVFTSNQTYYQCPHGEYSKDTLGHANHTASAAPPELSWLTQTKHQTNWSIYCKIIDNYTDQRLSFEADVLNAFAGISTFLSTSLFASFPFIIGIPACSLEVGLL